MTKNNINKKEFASIILQNGTLSPKQTEEGIEGILNFFQQCFKINCIIEIRGFGKFICKNELVKFKSYYKT